MLADLEAFRWAFLRLHPSLRLTSPVPTIVVLFKDWNSFARFQPRDEKGKREDYVAGYFITMTDMNLMLRGSQGDDSDFARSVVFHEYTPYLMHRNLQDIPIWLDEGLAELLTRDRELPAARLSLGLLRLQQERYQDAVDVLGSLVKDGPGNFAAHAYLASALVKTDKASEAVGAAERATVLNDQSPQARAVVEHGSWTEKVLDYFQGTRSGDLFLAQAKDNDQRTEAHAYIGFHEALAGRSDSAPTHLRWVREHGTKSFSEYGMAVAELKRLEKPATHQ